MSTLVRQNRPTPRMGRPVQQMWTAMNPDPFRMNKKSAPPPSAATVQPNQPNQDMGGPGQVPYTVAHPDPTADELNPDRLRQKPFSVPLSGPTAATRAVEHKNALILAKYRNIRYKGATTQQSMQRLIDIPENVRSSTLPSVDGQKEDEKANMKLGLKNPAYILSRENDREADAWISSANKIGGNWADDPGRAYFEFEPEYGDSVQITKDSVQASQTRANRFWIDDKAKPLSPAELARLRRRL